jgi:LacI family transcriptional regulator
MAIGAMQAVHEAGLRVPQDVSVVGFDDIPLSSYTRPRLTTISQPTHQIGKLAAEMLVERINDVDAPMKHEVLPVSLVVRESSAPPGGAS